MKATEFYFSPNDLFFDWSITDIFTEIGLLFFLFFCYGYFCFYLLGNHYSVLPEKERSNVRVPNRQYLALPTQWRIWAHSWLTVSSHEKSRQAHFEATQIAHSKLTRWACTVTLLRALHICLQLTPWACCEPFMRSPDHHAVVAVSSLWSHCDFTVNLTMRHSGGPTVSMALAHTFTGYVQLWIHL